jgi:hypothetical protein
MESVNMMAEATVDGALLMCGRFQRPLSFSLD